MNRSGRCGEICICDWGNKKYQGKCEVLHQEESGPIICNDAIRLSMRSENWCKQWAVIDVDKISDQGEARMKNVNKEDSKKMGAEKLKTTSRYYFWEEFCCKTEEMNRMIE